MFFEDVIIYESKDLLHVLGVSYERVLKLAKDLLVRKTPAGYEWTKEDVENAKDVLRSEGHLM